MRMTYHRIAYEALDVCNAVEMTTLEAAVVAAGPSPGARALDIGAGNGAVAIRLAERFGLVVDTVELDASMAELARTRIAASPMRERITLHQGRSGDVLTASPPFDLIVALGVTEPVGGGVRDPRGMLAGLAAHLAPGGRLLWGDLVWTAEPSPPLRQIVEMTNSYADHAGWQAAARAAGLTVLSAELSSPALWNRYRETMDAAVRDWLAANPDHPDAAAVAARAGQVRMMLDFGDGALGFGLYLLGEAG
jgi:protein-L-isoaspartate O-methyltransferase